MNFNSIDLGNYGLVGKLSSPSSFMPPVEINQVEIANKAYDFTAYLKPRVITLEVIITGTSKANLLSNLDNISKVLSPVLGVKKLILDWPDNRYYNAKVSRGIEYEIIGDKLAQGDIIFICPDPLAYDNDTTSSDFNIDVDPKTVTEATGGTGYIKPTYTLTAGEALNDITIKVECIATGEELQWTGSLANGEELEINVATWLVRKESVASMATVTGQFPRLLPGVGNRITITGFGTTGALNINYRNRFL